MQENFEKDALFYERTQKIRKIVNTALLSQGLLSWIVGQLHILVLVSRESDFCGLKPTSLEFCQLIIWHKHNVYLPI